MCSFGFITPLTYSGSKKDSFYNLIKPSVAPVAPVGDCSSSQTRCLLFHFHVMPARQMTNTGTNLSLWNTIQTPSLLFFLDHKCNMKVPVLIRKSSAMTAWGKRCPVKWKSGEDFQKGNAEKSLCCRLQITSIWHEGRWRAEAAPCGEPTENMLPATWQWHLDILFLCSSEGEKLGLVWWSQGFWCLLCYRKMQRFAIIVPLRLL